MSVLQAKLGYAAYKMPTKNVILGNIHICPRRMLPTVDDKENVQLGDAESNGLPKEG